MVIILVNIFKNELYLTIENDIVGEWVGCVYTTQKNKIHLFVGKVLKRFLSDDGASLNAFTTALEVDCLDEKLGTTDCVFKENERKDIGIFAIHNVICGPVRNGRFISMRKLGIFLNLTKKLTE